MKRGRNGAFSLIEVVLSIGVFGLAVLGLIGLMGPLIADLGSSRNAEWIDWLPAVESRLVELEVLEERASLPNYLFAFQWEISENRGSLRVADENELADAVARLATDSDWPRFGGPIVRFSLDEDGTDPAFELSGVSSQANYLPLEVSVRMVSAPDPGMDWGQMEERFSRAIDVQTVHIVITR